MPSLTVILLTLACSLFASLSFHSAYVYLKPIQNKNVITTSTAYPKSQASLIVRSVHDITSETVLP